MLPTGAKILCADVIEAVLLPTLLRKAGIPSQLIMRIAEKSQNKTCKTAGHELVRELAKDWQLLSKDRQGSKTSHKDWKKSQVSFVSF